MISGCTDEQTSADAIINNKATGAMTWSLLEGLKQKPGCSWRELITPFRTQSAQRGKDAPEGRHPTVAPKALTPFFTHNCPRSGRLPEGREKV